MDVSAAEAQGLSILSGNGKWKIWNASLPALN
jgi:hypothetical protein